MTTYFTEHDSVQTVNARATGAADPRLAEVMASLVKHLHAFVKEVGLTQDEWDAAIGFLTATGQLCSAERQEFILLSDVLGVSMLVDAINHQRPPGATENTVLGPFHVEGAPLRAMGDSICLDDLGEPCRFEGRVVDLLGSPVANACIDVWSDNAEGFYDVQQPEIQPRWNNRGRFITGGDGRYQFRGIKPTSYPIPDDGPVGALLTRLGRHPYRPAHMHFIITAPGYETVVTHTFVEGDPYLESDAVFGVKKSLTAQYRRVDGGDVNWQSMFDFVLVPTVE
jgi:hydroxyquinol 1,2-dioxygenase